MGWLELNYSAMLLQNSRLFVFLSVAELELVCGAVSMITALQQAMHAAPDINKTGWGYLFHKTYTNSNFMYSLLIINMEWKTFIFLFCYGFHKHCL